MEHRHPPSLPAQDHRADTEDTYLDAGVFFTSADDRANHAEVARIFGPMQRDQYRMLVEGGHI